MIAASARLTWPSGAPPAELPSQRQRLVQVVEVDLDRHLLALSGPDPDLVPERRLESVGCGLQRSGLLGIDTPDQLPFWLAGQLSPVLGLADRPTVPCRFARQAAADVIAACRQQRPAVTLAQLAVLEQLERLVGKIEQADQVGDGGAAAPDPAGQLLLGDAELLDQGRA